MLKYRYITKLLRKQYLKKTVQEAGPKKLSGFDFSILLLNRS